MSLTLFAPSADAARQMAGRLRPGATIAAIEQELIPADQDALRDFWREVKYICRPPATKRDKSLPIRRRRR